MGIRITKDLTDESLMPFGRHKGKKMIDVPASYLLYLLYEGLQEGDVRRYIVENEDALEDEAVGNEEN